MLMVYALAVAVFGGILPAIHFGSNNHITRLLITGVVNFVAALAIGYLVIPFMYGPFWGLSSSLIVFAIINSLIAGFFAAGGYHDWSFPQGGYFTLVVLVIIMFRGCAGSGAFNASEYRSIIGEVQESDWNKDIEPVDITHIRVVSKEQAEWLGNKVIGEAEGSIGSRYKFGNYSIQRVKGELYWVAPLEFRSFAKWQSYNHTTGYVMVSAEDRNRKPEFFGDFKFRYMPSAYFGDYLERYLYQNGYATMGLTEYTFELDENLKPWWVVTVYEPSIQYFAPKVKGVVLVDPQSGELNFFTPKEAPVWIDRIYPEEYVENYISWWGQYIQGWVNSWWGEEAVEIPTPFEGDGNDVWLVWGADGQSYWFTGLTSAASTDQSLTGFIMVNSRTLEARKYRLTGANEEGVLQAVDNTVSNYQGYRGVQPIMYNLYGELTWVVPIISSKNILQRIAFVRASNSTLALGSDVADGVRKYRNLLASSGYSTAPTGFSEYTTKKNLRLSRKSVESFGEKSMYFLFFEEIPDKVFTATSDISPELPITNVGEQVTISFLETREALVPIDRFDNSTLDIRTSDEQQELTNRREGVETEAGVRQDAKDIRKELDDMSPEEIRRLKEIMKNREN